MCNKLNNAVDAGVACYYKVIEYSPEIYVLCSDRKIIFNSQFGLQEILARYCSTSNSSSVVSPSSPSFYRVINFLDDFLQIGTSYIEQVIHQYPLL